MGGAAVPPDLPLKARARFGESIQLLNGYGLTETTSAVVTNVGVEFVERPDSVGRPNLTVALRRFRWDTTESVVMREPTYQISRQISGSQTTSRVGLARSWWATRSTSR